MRGDEKRIKENRRRADKEFKVESSRVEQSSGIERRIEAQKILSADSE